MSHGPSKDEHLPERIPSHDKVENKPHCCSGLFLAGATQSFGQTVPPSTPEQVNKLIAVIKSDAPQKEKVDACRQLGVIGTKDAVAPLAALLGDEKLSHIADMPSSPTQTRLWMKPCAMPLAN